MNSNLSSATATAAHGALIAARPTLAGCGSLGAFRDLPERVLLHAGPAYTSPLRVPRPVMNSAVSAVLFEGWATSEIEARDQLLRGAITLLPAQDFAVVTPLAFVAGPGTAVLRIADAAGIAPDRYCPVNDGPPDAALRFGAPTTPGRVDRLATLRAIAPALDVAIADGVALLPVMEAGVVAGDDLHGQVAGVTEALKACLLPRIDEPARGYVAAAGQFGLNAVMGACAVMLAAAGTVQTDFICAAGGNGVDFGWQLASAPGVWWTAPAKPPVGPLFAGLPTVRALPAIGDSAVIDACGFGAAILRYAPALIEALAPFHASATFDGQASAGFVGTHPHFPPDIRVGLRAASIAQHPGIILAMLDADGRSGLIGRGIAPWPVA